MTRSQLLERREQALLKGVESYTYKLVKGNNGYWHNEIVALYSSQLGAFSNSMDGGDVSVKASVL